MMMSASMSRRRVLGGIGAGPCAALGLAAPRLRGRLVFAGLLLLPFLVPKTVLLSWPGLSRGAPALIAAQTLMAFPFTTAIVTVIVLAMLIRLDRRLVAGRPDRLDVPGRARPAPILDRRLGVPA